MATTATTAEQTGMKPGATYEFTCTAACVARWGADDASAADGGFDFAVPTGAVVRSVCPTGDTAINIIRVAADGNCLISRVDPA